MKEARDFTFRCTVEGFGGRQITTVRSAPGRDEQHARGQLRHQLRQRDAYRLISADVQRSSPVGNGTRHGLSTNSPLPVEA